MESRASLTLMAITPMYLSSQIAMEVTMVEVVVTTTMGGGEVRITKTSNLRRNSSNHKRESGHLLHHK